VRSKSTTQRHTSDRFTVERSPCQKDAFCAGMPSPASGQERPFDVRLPRETSNVVCHFTSNNKMNLDTTLRIRCGLIVTAVVVALPACSGVDPSTLRRPSRPAELTLTKAVVWTYKEAPLRPVTYNGSISPGKYVAEYESPSGTYFWGPPGCFASEAIAVSADDQRAALGKVFENDCGLFVPTNKAEAVKLYGHIGSQIRQRGTGHQASPLTDEAVAGGVQQALNPPVVAAAPVGAVAAGGAMGGAIVGGIIASSQGNLNFFRQQPATEELRKALRAD
jgi:hypothetical protein